jgi:hypothetical protein
MRLKYFHHDFDKYNQFEIEDMAFFHTMVTRMIEDVEIMVGFLAKRDDEPEVTEDLVREALRVVDPVTITQLADTSQVAIVNSQMVIDFARPSLPHNEESIALISKYLNFRLIRLLYDAAERADEEGLNKIKLRHYLPLCEEWPWPLNRWC